MCTCVPRRNCVATSNDAYTRKWVTILQLVLMANMSNQNRTLKATAWTRFDKGAIKENVHLAIIYTWIIYLILVALKHNLRENVNRGGIRRKFQIHAQTNKLTNQISFYLSIFTWAFKGIKKHIHLGFLIRLN